MSAGDLAVVFDWAGDRWSHRLEFGGTTLRIEASAVESDASRDAPARIVSPVYQEIHRHRLAGQTGLCCLSTGLVFQHHFSAVVTLAVDAVQPEMLLLEFDVADRCRTQVEALAATYLVTIDSSELADADPHRIVWTGGRLGKARLELTTAPPATLALAEAGSQAKRVQVVAQIDPETFTHRIFYRWCWTSASNLTR